MDLSQFVRKLPPGASAPVELAHEGLVARAITRQDLADDVRGINASLALIRRTRGGGWPTEPVTEEGNYTDLVWHELEFREGTSFATSCATAAAATSAAATCTRWGAARRSRRRSCATTST